MAGMGEPAQHAVALQVPVGVIDLLEVVDVEQQQGQLGDVALGVCQLRFQTLSIYLH